MDWFLYDNGLCHERVNVCVQWESVDDLKTDYAILSILIMLLFQWGPYFTPYNGVHLTLKGMASAEWNAEEVISR